MDEIVKAALKKWPNVPACYGWLGLDARGDWYMRDDHTQHLGTFQSGVPGAKGSRLMHDKLIEFIGRNYDCDEQGRWYFQNGPQRVFVELTDAPWVWRLSENGDVHSHTGVKVQVLAVYLDEVGRLYLNTPLGLGLVHSQDMLIASGFLEAGQWQLHEVVASHLDAAHHFVLSPQAQLPQSIYKNKA
jgi:hypothetical protein